MPAEIQLRDQSEGERREQLFDVLSGAEVGDTIEVVADSDIDPQLVRYQLEQDRSLEWEYADPDREPRELQVTVGEPLGDESLPTIDVRDLKPQRRHEALLEIFDGLAAGEGFVLVNDHDPKPLYHELKSMHGDVIEWDYASQGGGEWRVEIVKTGDSEASDEDIVTRYDVREIPKQERHPTIHHRYGMIPEGGTMELIAPHEPRPLQREFRQQYGDAFTWEVVESEPGRCRVQVTKTKSTDESGDSDAAADDVSAAPSDDESLNVTEELDVRDLPPAQRHEQIFEAYAELDAGSGFVLVNDHDPKPLYHQFEAEAGPEFRWTYRQQDPGEFRVLIGKAETTVDESVDEETEVPF
ncbi:DUF2249 domain-containing protein [Haloarcula japonica]|uniref:DUF2249 domain-containing protein n=1 Tax=Haloarcula japonica (strain ATCC 49778 / DSM 6131 / JCM 7785 / NBRC 101032 / NCIMB 13157 / TR-1) TaxID=1227453 RepID=M0L2L8_HALJT|nr:DUF2249 domain-containing protein [Haloarcula japonica]EMA27822.1 hypothetical protein C444_20097 [Haloarcula japonica DSM 6131]